MVSEEWEAERVPAVLLCMGWRSGIVLVGSGRLKCPLGCFPLARCSPPSSYVLYVVRLVRGVVSEPRVLTLKWTMSRIRRVAVSTYPMDPVILTILSSLAGA